MFTVVFPSGAMVSNEKLHASELPGGGNRQPSVSIIPRTVRVQADGEWNCHGPACDRSIIQYPDFKEQLERAMRAARQGFDVRGFQKVWKRVLRLPGSAPALSVAGPVPALRPDFRLGSLLGTDTLATHVDEGT